MNTSVLSLPGSANHDPLDSLAQEFEDNFRQLSEEAGDELAGRPFLFSRYGKELYPYFEETDATTVPGCIIPVKEGRPVASVDSTCIMLGESQLGALYAARTAVGISFEGALRRFFRFGPLLVYASQEAGLAGLGGQMTAPELSLILSDRSVAERVIRNLVERRVLAALLEGGGVTAVADGSLKHPAGLRPGHPGLRVPAGSCLVGFSKSSGLMFAEGAMAALARAELPSYCMVDGGRVPTVLAKFTKGGLVFRLDLECADEGVDKVLGRIAWNDAFSSGYPDSLKVAHHLSVFSGAEVQGLKALVKGKFRLRELPSFPLRSVALGSFKGGA